MKKKLLIGAMLVLVLGLTVMGTSAFFTQEETAHNVVTTGGIDIELIEKAIVDGEEVDFKDVYGVLPGADVSKIVTVRNIGENEAFIRVSVKKSIDLAEGVEGEPDLSLITFDFNTDDWTEGKDGYWYCSKPLGIGETTPALFTTVSFSKSMDNMYQKCAAHVDIKVQAVQTANNGKTALEAAGWPKEA